MSTRPESIRFVDASSWACCIRHTRRVQWRHRCGCMTYVDLLCCSCTSDERRANDVTILYDHPRRYDWIQIRVIIWLDNDRWFVCKPHVFRCSPLYGSISELHFEWAVWQYLDHSGFLPVLVLVPSSPHGGTRRNLWTHPRVCVVVIFLTQLGLHQSAFRDIIFTGGWLQHSHHHR